MDGGVEGAKERLGFGVELVALRIGKEGWGWFLGVAFVVVVLLETWRRVDAKVGLTYGEEVGT